VVEVALVPTDLLAGVLAHARVALENGATGKARLRHRHAVVVGRNDNRGNADLPAGRTGTTLLRRV
jgi:hypothetical protein